MKAEMEREFRHIKEKDAINALPCPLCGRKPEVEYYTGIDEIQAESISCKYCGIAVSSVDISDNAFYLMCDTWNEKIRK